MTKNQTFEERLKVLEEIVKELDSNIPLEKAISKYDEGVKIADECQKDLSQVEKKIMKIVEENKEPKVEIIEEHEFPTLF